MTGNRPAHNHAPINANYFHYERCDDKQNNCDAILFSPWPLRAEARGGQAPQCALAASGGITLGSGGAAAVPSGCPCQADSRRVPHEGGMEGAAGRPGSCGVSAWGRLLPSPATVGASLQGSAA
ncbi:hypothetical protein EMIHUDRAFT_234876 [Emiliania huxleyi CCMP1516]|uniref:Uncharacterized protein n=2 Tax=Emiliania huxleyi TaxID=2903 RepID=A0A0D3JXN5_EMIH1|nr:hypothetical protein EMIHUDRAFT_234876 [Emiliania huxleyi CCMP1516]EOD28270.1 hypothetical protein EMIHUDRAFT_234876 [Emiliania huxleyi CCMP1516]|eukprot:XP_005780699.1 hypothetical protein EMIHUDRAFT_234876 [Emiliania huxleyi CCMP1516]